MRIRTQYFSSLIIVCIFYSHTLLAQDFNTSKAETKISNLSFSDLELDKKLGESPVHSIEFDKGHNLWIGTENGLMLYNGGEVKHYNNNPHDTFSLKTNFIKDIAIDDNNNVWIGTWGGGLHLYSRDNDNFQKIVPESKSKYDDQIWSLAIDSKNNVWIGGFTNGLYKYNPANNTGRSVAGLTTVAKRESLRINKILPINKNRILVLTHGEGLFLIDAETLDVLDHKKESSDATIKSAHDIIETDSSLYYVAHDTYVSIVDIVDNKIDIINSITTDDAGRATIFAKYGKDILLGTEKSIVEVDSENSSLNYIMSNTHPHYPSGAILWDSANDSDGCLLISTNNGISFADPRLSIFKYYYLDLDGNTEVMRQVRSISSSNNSLYVGYLNSIAHIPDHAKDDTQIISVESEIDISVTSILKIDDTLLYAYADTLFFIDESSKQVIDLNLERHDAKLGYVSNLIDDKANLWIGTQGAGLIKFNKNTHDYEVIDFSSKLHQKHKRLVDIEYTGNNHLIAGSFSGLSRIDMQKLIYLEPSSNPSINAEFNNRYVGFIRRLAKDKLLIGTDHGAYEAHTNENLEIIRIDKLLDDTPWESSVYFGGYPDSKGNLWLLSGSGVITINKDRTVTSLVVSPSDPIPFGISTGATHQRDDGTIFFGGRDGLLSFNPEEYMPGKQQGFHKLKINKFTAIADNRSQHWTNYDLLSELSHDNTIIRISYGTINFTSPWQVLYEYRLLGFSESWSDAGTRTEAVYTNLNPGEYAFEVRARLPSGIIIPSPELLAFRIIPPWWQTWWAYTLYALSALLLIAWFVWSQNRKLIRERAITTKLREADTLRNYFVEQLQEQVSSATSELRDSMEAMRIKNVELEIANKRAQQATQFKSEFFANMSHEIRTPMSGIIGFVDLLSKTRLDNDQSEYVNTIRRSASGLVTIINDILDVSKIEAGKLVIDEIGFDLRDCLEDTLGLLAPIGYEKGLELVCIYSPEIPPALQGDPARLRQVITNLVGNAIKFTHKGSVCVRVELDNLTERKAHVTIAVSDTGIGISEANQKRLFQAFSQADNSVGRSYGGTGLGLNICKMLVEAMGGTIDLHSTPGIGSTFVVSLALNKELNPSHSVPVTRQLEATSILLYDSHPLSIQANANLLSLAGAKVTEVQDTAALMTELSRQRRKSRYNACVIALTALEMQSADVVKDIVSRHGGDVPLAISVSTVDIDLLRELSGQLGVPCFPKLGGSKALLDTLAQVRLESVEFSDTVRNLGAQKGKKQSLLTGKQLLVTDDNEANRELLAAILRRHGAQISQACDGKETLAMLDGQDWDLLLLDIHMPGMSGLEIAARIRRNEKSGGKRMPIIAVSANAQPEMRKQAKSMGIDDYLVKPFTEELLLQAIRKQLGAE